MRKGNEWSFEKDNNNKITTKLVTPSKTDLRKKDKKHKLSISATNVSELLTTYRRHQE